MKKTLMRTITIISFLLILFSNTSIANATTLEKTDNDYYVETIITNVDSDLNFIALHSNSHTITKTKTANIKNANGTILWSVSITATFIYDGSTSPNATSYSSEWKIQSVSSNKSGNSATASATANYASLKNYTQNVTISCSKNGTVS
jgi:hypothetical protein